MKHVHEGSTVHITHCMCLYDLQKAFDSVEFPVLLDKFFSIGVNWKTWRNRYEGSSCHVRVENRFSNSFSVQRGM